MPKVIDPATGWVQNCNDVPWTLPMALDPKAFAPGFAAPSGITPRAQRSLSGTPTMTFADLKAGKLSTHVETSDQFLDDLLAAARARGTPRANDAADVLARWGGCRRRRCGPCGATAS